MKKKSVFANKKNIFLAVVAFILICVMSVGVTYSWIDDLKEVQISTNDDGENTPLTVGKNIHAEYQIGGSEENIINLGRMISKNDGKDVIDDEGYFYESGDMHLTPCYSDGKNFIVPTTNSGTRTTHIDDNDVSFITVTLKITSPTAKTEFWFKGVPSFTYNKNNATENDFEDRNAMRVSITSDGATNVYTNYKEYDDYVYYSSSSKALNDGRGFKEYTYNNESNVSSTRGKNGNTLFSIGKGETKEVTFKIWLEDGRGVNPNYSSVDIDLKLVSSFTKTRKITIKNKTTGVSANSWMFDSQAKIYVAIPAARTGSTWTKYNGSNTSTASYWDISNDLETKDEATITVPAYYNDEDLIVFRCKKSGWNTGAAGSGGIEERSEYGVKCWNFWSTKIPNTFKNETYTMYGATYDGTVSRLYYNDWTFYNKENEGYGTWDPVIKIYFDANYSGNSNQNYAFWEYYWDNGVKKTKGACNLFIEDFSDYSQNGHVYYYTMYPSTNDDNGNSVWTAYVPQTSTKISFRYNYDYDTDNQHKNHYWGFLVQESKGADVRSRQVYTSGYERPSDAYTFTSKSIPNDDGLAKGEWSSGGNQDEPQQPEPQQPDDTDDLGNFTVDSGMKVVYDNTEYILYGVDSSISTGKIFKASIPVTSTEQKELKIKNVGNDILGLNLSNQSFTLPRNAGSYTLYKGYNQTIYPVKVSGATGNYILTCEITQLDNGDASNINITSISKS